MFYVYFKVMVIVESLLHGHTSDTEHHVRAMHVY
jgi:hypothetical protein